LIPSRYGAIGEKVKDESQLRGNIQWDALPDRSTQEQRSVLPTLVDSKKLYQSHKSAALPVSDDCVAANEEAKKANGVTEVADKLFHNRRALRLCPESPALHHGLAAVYLELGRIEDAKFELEEALRLDPSYAPASISLKSLSAPATVVY
jgi:tetratricopeptide (TPR) repeat protein